MESWCCLKCSSDGEEGRGGTMGQKGMGMQWIGAQWAGGTMDGPHHSQDMLVLHVCTKVQPIRRQVHMNWTRWSTGSHSASWWHQLWQWTGSAKWINLRRMPGALLQVNVVSEGQVTLQAVEVKRGNELAELYESTWGTYLVPHCVSV